MDCNMPLMDGFETTRGILQISKENNVSSPYIVALTAHNFSENTEIKKKCYAYGMNQCLSKPINTDEIKELFIRLDVKKPQS